MNLNNQQQKVVNEIDKNIILLASAGTGKTDTLSRRIGNIISKGRALSSEILCITFTNKAAKEMEDRVKKIVLDKAKGITIRTFHSFCFDIIKSEAKRKTDIYTDFTIFDEDDSKEIIKNVIQEDIPSEIIQRFISLVKEESINRGIVYKEAINYLFKNREKDIDYVCKQGKYVDNNIKRYLFIEGENIVNMYNKSLIDNHGLDFNDLIIKAKEILEDDKALNRIRSKYKYINIDEVQDTSIIEYSIIEKVFYNSNVLICGDKFQTIYGWRGSRPNSILESFREKYNPIEITFRTNYRATKTLTNAGSKFLINAFCDEAKSIYENGIDSESNDIGDKISFKENDSIYDEARYIYSEIKDLNKKGIDVSKTCILTRDNSYNIDLSKEMSYIHSIDDGFEFVLVDQFKFFRRMEVKDLLSFLKLIGNKHDCVSFKRIIKRLPLGIGDKTIEAIESVSYKEAGILLSDFLDEKTLKGEYFTLLIEEFHNDNIIIFDVESTGVNVTEDEIVQIAAIKINSKGETIDVFERFLIPSKSVGDSFHVHGFSDEFLRENGEDKQKVLNDFIEFSRNAVIVGHNVQYDINILTSELSRNNIKETMFKGFYDTLDIYRRFHPNMENHKLDTLSKIFKVMNKPDHNAMNDILATGEILVRAIKKDISISSLERIGYVERHLKSFSNICERLNKLFDFADKNKPHDIIFYIIKEFNLKDIYKNDSADDKMERLRDFYKMVKDMNDPDKSNRDSLLDVLRLTSLSNGELEKAIINRMGRNRIPIITVHQSKGLEYENVFIAGLQEGRFPSYMAIRDNNLDEEKRTFYVAMTRAKKRLYLSCNLESHRYKSKVQSQFISLIPNEYIEYK